MGRIIYLLLIDFVITYFHFDLGFGLMSVLRNQL